MQFGIFSVSDITTDPTTGRTPTDAQRIQDRNRCASVPAPGVHRALTGMPTTPAPWGGSR